MKKTLILSAFLLIGGYVLAQSETDEDTQTQDQTTPVQAEHGKTISELAKTTTGGREKGAIISSAARQKSLLHANVNTNTAGSNASATGVTASTIGTSLKPEAAGIPLTPGKPLTLPPVTAPTQGKPIGLPGGQ